MCGCNTNNEKMVNKIIWGECLLEMQNMEENSVDTIITDPPYGLSFMGKKWDYEVPSIETWQECLRVLKPGGTLLCFAGSRTQHRMAVNVEDSGFILKDCIMWLYGSGFPKATDISKQLDKKHKREVIGSRKTHDIRNNNLMEASQGKGKGTMTYEYTIPTTPEAKLWNGWKSHGLKPAYEPILVAQKPNEGTYANNALKWGVSGLWIDGGRIGTEERINKGMSKNKPECAGTFRDDNWIPKDVKNVAVGRFPANIILDEEAGRMLDEQSGVSKSTNNIRKNNGKFDDKTFGKYKPIDSNGFKDKGGASRFFYCAKASKSERNAGCEELNEKKIEIQQPHNSKNLKERYLMTSKNNHPTVKPLKLMEYLCKLTKTPTGGIVLDPFCGSGTTGIAAYNVGRSFIGIESNEEYVNIARARLKHNMKQEKLNGK
jgi:site-specific DNA-methyltransferase (adenine-specific)